MFKETLAMRCAGRAAPTATDTEDDEDDVEITTVA
jgi:hypothetical protein